MIVLYCIICGSQSYILFKISASGLFLKCSKHFENFNLDILVKHIFKKKKEFNDIFVFRRSMDEDGNIDKLRFLDAGTERYRIRMYVKFSEDFKMI